MRGTDPQLAGGRVGACVGLVVVVVLIGLIFVVMRVTGNGGWIAGDRPSTGGWVSGGGCGSVVVVVLVSLIFAVLRVTGNGDWVAGDRPLTGEREGGVRAWGRL